MVSFSLRTKIARHRQRPICILGHGLRGRNFVRRLGMGDRPNTKQNQRDCYDFHRQMIGTVLRGGTALEYSVGFKWAFLRFE